MSCAGGDVLMLGLACVFYTLLLFLLELGAFSFLGRLCEPKQPAPSSRRHDNVTSHSANYPDVVQEVRECDQLEQRLRTQNGPTEPPKDGNKEKEGSQSNKQLQPQEELPAIVALHLQKIYRTSLTKVTQAVCDVSFHTRKGECFAILGTNGAGKTTTFKMLTCDVIATKGDIYIDGLKLRENFARIRKMIGRLFCLKIGYCPQYDAAFMALTTRENLEFYTKVKGIPPDTGKQLIDKILVEMQLDRYANYLAGDLSGGNKRKLTVAIALLGNPPIVLLDEPSTGVDPEAKRFMWKVIQRITVKNRQTAVILTTHSMEEAEALCTKMAIMVAGNFRCIGSPQQLKHNFADGYEVQINVTIPTEAEVNAFLAPFQVPSKTLLQRFEVQEIFRRIGLPDLSQEIRQNGYASDFHREFEAGRGVTAASVAHFALIETRGRHFALELARVFGEVTIPEHYNNFYKFRVNKTLSTQTIGHLFGLIQELCQRFQIPEFSASQTTLAQIFHSLVRKTEVP